jgi:FkbM family methyltransferase
MVRPTGIEIIETIYGTFFSWAGDLFSEQLKTYSAHTRNELAMLRSFLRCGDNVVDIGAHIGTFCIPFTRFIGEQGRVYAFEANPDNYALLERNIQANGLHERIHPVCAVVSETSGSFKKMLPTGGNSGMYYFLDGHHAADGELSSINVDRWMAQNASGLPLHLIKIDTEGAEVNMLRACKGIIEEQRPIIYCEINVAALKSFNSSPQDIQSFLNSFGYHFFRNTGQRNSDNDEYAIAHLKNLKQGGPFFDVLAIHPSSERYPKR